MDPTQKKEGSMRLYPGLMVLLGILWLAASACKSGDATAQTAPGPETIADETQTITNAYLVASSQLSGPIDGEARAAGREGWIPVLGWFHGIERPLDASSGATTGEPKHTPIVIRKRIDHASPLISKALADNDQFDEWILRVYRETDAGQEQHYYSITLQNARVAGVHTTTESTHEVREEVSFSYQKITWTFEEGGITAEDDWETPLGG
jgi:type VI secretion system secreted protein Hcp